MHGGRCGWDTVARKERAMRGGKRGEQDVDHEKLVRSWISSLGSGSR